MAKKNKAYLLLVILAITPFIVLSIFIFDNSSTNTKTDDLSNNKIKEDLADDTNNYYVINDANYKIEIGREQLSESLQNAKNWLFSNFNTGGYFTYEYDPLNDQYSNNNNMIRQLMASRVLAKEVEKHDDLLNWRNANSMHKMNLRSIFNNWYSENDDLGYIYFGNKSKLGAMAMAIRVLVSSPYFEKYEDTAVKLANTILYLQNDDGSFRAWYIEPDYNYSEERLLRFYSGEAILSLIELYEITENKVYLDAAIKSQDFYLRDYIDHMEEDEDYYPAFIPWHSICLNKLFFITGDIKYRDAIFKITDKVITMQNQTGKPDIDFLGRFYNPDTPQYGTPHSASTSVYLEGVVYAYEIAEMVEDFERIYEYKKSIILGTHNLMNLQFKGADMYYMANPQRVWGAIRVGVESSRIRIDTTGHTIDAFRKIVEVFELD